MQKEAGSKNQQTAGSAGLLSLIIARIVQRGRLTDPAASHWFQERRLADRRIRDLSKGELVLLSRVYFRDDERHQLVHEGCGRPFWASVDEVTASGPAICPFCNPTDDLSRFGAMEAVQHYVIEASMSNAYIYAAPLGSPTDVYDFFCFRHKKPYRATFTEFQRLSGTTNACPHCARMECPGSNAPF